MILASEPDAILKNECSLVITYTTYLLINNRNIIQIKHPIVAAVSSTMLLCKYGTTKHMYTGCTIPDLKLPHISPKSCIDKTILVTYLPTFNRTKIFATELWCMGCTPNTRKLQLVKKWVAKSRPSFCKPCTYFPFSNLLANYLHTTINIYGTNLQM